MYQQEHLAVHQPQRLSHFRVRGIFQALKLRKVIAGTNGTEIPDRAFLLIGIPTGDVGQFPDGIQPGYAPLHLEACPADAGGKQAHAAADVVSNQVGVKQALAQNRHAHRGFPRMEIRQAHGLYNSGEAAHARQLVLGRLLHPVFMVADQY